MREKVIIVVFLLLVIAGLLVIGSAGFGGSNPFQGLSTLFKFGSSDHFAMQLVVNKDAFAGKSLEVSNTTIHINGICVGYVYVFGANIAKDGRCGILIDQAKGKIEYSTIGTIEGTLESTQINLDGSVIVPGNDKRIKFSIAPTDVYISNYNTGNMNLPAASGEIQKFKPDGTQDQLKLLSNEKVEILNYIGSVRVTANSLILNGFATKVNWFG